MKQLLSRISGVLFAGFAMLMLFCSPAYAVANPMTGDPSERIIGWIFVALGASLIVIIILFIVLGKNRKD